MQQAQILSAKPVTRNYGVDALRLLAMFFVVTLHVLGTGEVTPRLSGISYQLAILIQTISFCAVNCYIAITGFVSYSDTESPYRYEKYASMWFMVFFYSVSVTLVAFLVGWGNVGVKELVYAVLPVTSGRYWYFSRYTAIFFLIPYLNRLPRSLTNKQMSALALLLFVMFACYEAPTNPFMIGNGYSLPWLVIMYLLGAWVKKCRIADKVKPVVSILTLVGCWLITWLFTLYSPFKSDLLMSYTSPTMALAALSMLLLFSKMKLNARSVKIVRCFAPAAFGVYIIHMQPVLKEALLPYIFTWIAELSWWLVPLAALGCSAAVFVLCLLIEKLRIRLFACLKINQFCERIFLKAFATVKSLVEKLFLGKLHPSEQE